jgi:hypothetical protein
MRTETGRVLGQPANMQFSVFPFIKHSALGICIPLVMEHQTMASSDWMRFERSVPK